MRVLIARPVPTHSPPHLSSHPCPSTTPLPPTPPFCTPHQRASTVLRHGDTPAPPSALAMAAPPALPLPLPFVTPAPLVHPPRFEPHSRIYVACIFLKAYPCDVFMEPVFAKKTPAANAGTLLRTPCAPKLNVEMAPEGSLRRCEKKRPPLRGHTSHPLSNIDLGGAGALGRYALRFCRGRFFRKHRNALPLVLKL